MEKEIEGFLVEDEKKMRIDEIFNLINRMKEFAKLGKEGGVIVQDKTLTIITKLKLFLVTRYLGEQLDKLKPELEINSPSLLTIKEISHFLEVPEPNSRVRMSTLVAEGFARRPEIGKIQVNPSKIEDFIARLEDGKTQKGPGNIPSSTSNKKIRKRVEKFNITEEELFERLSNNLESDKEKIKEVLFIMRNGLFKFNKISKNLESKHAKQIFIILCSAYILLNVYDKKTFNTGTISHICFNSYVDNSNIKDAMKSLKRKNLISSAARATQENTMLEEGKKKARELLKELLSES